MDRDLIREALEGARKIIQEDIDMITETSYGHFHGGDPRDFRPDPECSTEEERAKHKADCERWEEAEANGKRFVEAEPGPHIALMDPKTGKTAGWATRCGYGLGTNVYRAPEHEAALEKVEAALKVLG